MSKIGNHLASVTKLPGSKIMGNIGEKSGSQPQRKACPFIAKIDVEKSLEIVGNRTLDVNASPCLGNACMMHRVVQTPNGNVEACAIALIGDGMISLGNLIHQATQGEQKK